MPIFCMYWGKKANFRRHHLYLKYLEHQHSLFQDTAVSCLTNVYRSETVSEHTDPKRRRLVVEALHETWQTLSVTAVTQYAVLQNVVSSLYSLAAYVQSELDNKHILLVSIGCENKVRFDSFMVGQSCQPLRIVRKNYGI